MSYSHPYLVIVTEHGHTQQHRFSDIQQARAFYRAMVQRADLYGRTVLLIDNGIEAERVDNA